MAIPRHFIDELRNRISMVELVGRRVQLKKRGRDHWGCCPFHGEKTPSFKVSEDRDDYHCFGCGAHGSAFDFVMNTDGVSFPEAIERLAELAGMQVPEQAPEEREQADRLTRLAEACEAAAKWFTAQLRGTAGDEARAYLDRRGVSESAIESFRLGYAPDRNDGLKAALLERGFKEVELIEAGLIAQPDDGRASYDRFRNRLIFPIADRRGRVIAFGGRALGEARAKYLNSPETPLFSKSRTLYNHAMARGGARDAGTVIVAEGYMDVIALAEAGLSHAVAPLGTAVTEEQIGLLWQMTSEPVLCLDGDAAGLRAAQRAAERALPLLKPGKSLRFALLPEGMDPDDLLRSEGPAGVKKVLERTISMLDLLWRGAMTGRVLDTPERRAGLEQDLTRLGFQVQDETIRQHYLDDFRARARSHFRQMRQPARNNGGWRPGPRRADAFEDVTRLKGLMQTDGSRAREESILGALITWPALMTEFEAQLDTLQFRHAELDQVYLQLRQLAETDAPLDSEAITRHFDAAGLQPLIARLSTPTAARLNFGSRTDEAPARIGEQFGALLRRYRIELLEDEHAEAVQVSRRDLSQAALERQFALQQELERLRASETAALRDGNAHA